MNSPFKTFALCFAITVFVAGCGKKSENAVTTTLVRPTDHSSTNASDAKISFTDEDAALRMKDYNQAAQVLLDAQKKQLSEQQLQELNNRMRSLQSSLAQAAASGDQNAIAAGQALREAHAHQ